ncbi:phage antirepressor KilAC domain-containing protein [Streptomyces turgidiscabies]|uniref:phage antirepressor KilAC domain-containing protein n=1 Tax=Streptomyces turgidiscabies TaxID=85558 RepID=UPI0038F660AD
MLPILPSNGQSPFDALRGLDDRWSARQLQSLMGYSRWENLAPALDRAMTSARNEGLDVEENFLGSQEVSGSRGPAAQDFRLTRHAAYLLAMNGDPNKQEVADAQGYFARKTREAETRPTPALPDMATPQGRMAVARMLLESTERELELTTRVADLEPKALAHDTLMAAAKGDVLVRQAAKVLGWKERDLRAFLLDEHLIYRRQQTCGGWEYDFYAAHAEQFNAVKTVVEHTWGSCAHYTLHLTPRGLAFVQMRIGKRQSEMHAAIQGGAR